MAVSQAAEKHATYTDPEKAGRDFLVQGEYQGSLGNGKVIAAQVISLGNAKFEGFCMGAACPAPDGTKNPVSFPRGNSGDTTHCVGIHGERPDV